MKKTILITKDEKAILKYLGRKYNYIARDKNNTLYVYQDKPVKDSDFEVWMYQTKSNYKNVFSLFSDLFEWENYENIPIFSDLFTFIKWEDDEPYLIEDLLKGE